MLEVRAMVEEDLHEAGQQFFDTFTKAPWFDKWTDADHARIYLLEFFQNPAFIGFVITDNGQIIGASYGSKTSFYTGATCHINEFFISDHVQSKGLGTIFMAEIEKLLAQKNIHLITLLTDRNTPAEKFYDKVGFTADQMNIFYYKRF